MFSLYGGHWRKLRDASQVINLENEINFLKLDTFLRGVKSARNAIRKSQDAPWLQFLLNKKKFRVTLKS